uniref:Uncharacterized protein n=1 Tax=Acrobeloides nanus TaxID=290746 RepID=A0A914EIA0_9BILA
MNFNSALFWLFSVFISCVMSTPLAYRPWIPAQYQNYQNDMSVMKRNAELINGLIGMDLNKLSAIGKRSNAELINGLIGMNLNKLASAGRK